MRETGSGALNADIRDTYELSATNRRRKIKHTTAKKKNVPQKDNPQP